MSLFKYIPSVHYHFGDDFMIYNLQYCNLQFYNKLGTLIANPKCHLVFHVVGSVMR
jgi:hypothetical protein